MLPGRASVAQDALFATHGFFDPAIRLLPLWRRDIVRQLIASRVVGDGTPRGGRNRSNRRPGVPNLSRESPLFTWGRMRQWCATRFIILTLGLSELTNSSTCFEASSLARP